MIRSLRAQLALWHGGLLAVTLILLATLTYLVLRQVLNSLADATLQDYADKTAKDVALKLYQAGKMNPDRPLSDKLRNSIVSTVLNYGSVGRLVQIDDPLGRWVAGSDALRTDHFPDSASTRARILARRDRVVFENLRDPWPDMRVVTVPVEMGAEIPYLVRVGAPIEGVEDAINRVSVLLLILTPSVFIIALAGGWILVGRSLQPVDEMTRAALSIESKRLDVRLVPARTDNEIGRLASALNEMIARLDRSFRQTERFSADASHELKTPLTTIRGEAEVALMGDLNPEQVRATLKSIVEESERLSEIVNNLLLLSRADANQVRLKRDTVSLDQIAMQAFEPMERLAHRKSITLDIASMEEIALPGDALWLQQLITNLLHNAINYTPEGGTVTLSVAREAGGDFALVEVRDTGPGIPEEHLPHIFDRFYRVDSGRSRDQGGSGLGLNIARWVAESHGGTLSAASTPGKGSTFTVRLPIHTQP